MRMQRDRKASKMHRLRSGIRVSVDVAQGPCDAQGLHGSSWRPENPVSYPILLHLAPKPPHVDKCCQRRPTVNRCLINLCPALEGQETAKRIFHPQLLDSTFGHFHLAFAHVLGQTLAGRHPNMLYQRCSPTLPSHPRSLATSTGRCWDKRKPFGVNEKELGRLWRASQPSRTLALKLIMSRLKEEVPFELMNCTIQEARRTGHQLPTCSSTYRLSDAQVAGVSMRFYLFSLGFLGFIDGSSVEIGSCHKPNAWPIKENVPPPAPAPRLWRRENADLQARH